jgi:hypothetical protein
MCVPTVRLLITRRVAISCWSRPSASSVSTSRSRRERGVGRRWWKLNSLSGGAAPSAFKGYALNPAAPGCGVNWSTDPGNSAPPPAGPLPAYMAVIVTSSTSKSGSQISGNTTHVVIVRTNPGYDPNAGHAGTGTVVATVC